MSDTVLAGSREPENALIFKEKAIRILIPVSLLISCMTLIGHTR